MAAKFANFAALCAALVAYASAYPTIGIVRGPRQPPAAPSPFVCPPPNATVTANSTHVSTLVRAWSAQAAEGTFAYVAETGALQLAASQPVASLRSALFAGACSLDAASAAYPRVGSLTRAPEGAAVGATTGALAAVTPQAAGCACAVASVDSRGVVSAADPGGGAGGCGADEDGGAFYASQPGAIEGRWLLRQKVLAESVAQCALETQMLEVMTMQQFSDSAKRSRGGYVRTFAVVELGMQGGSLVQRVAPQTVSVNAHEGTVGAVVG